VAKDPRDLPSLYRLAEVVSQEGGAGSDAEYQRLLEKILEVQPNNLPVLAKRAAAAHERKDLAAFQDTLGRLARLAPDWPPGPRKTLDQLGKAVKDNAGDVPLLLVELDN